MIQRPQVISELEAKSNEDRQMNKGMFTFGMQRMNEDTTLPERMSYRKRPRFIVYHSRR